MYKKIKLKERPFVLHIFIEEQPLLYLKKQKGFTKKHQKDLTPLPQAQAMAFDISDVCNAHYVIWLEKAPSHTKLGCLVHELFHIVTWHFRYIGQTLDESSEESYAYMLDYLVDLIYDLYNKHKEYGNKQKRISGSDSIEKL